MTCLGQTLLLVHTFLIKNVLPKMQNELTWAFSHKAQINVWSNLEWYQQQSNEIFTIYMKWDIKYFKLSSEQ